MQTIDFQQGRIIEHVDFQELSNHRISLLTKFLKAVSSTNSSQNSAAVHTSQKLLLTFLFYERQMIGRPIW